MHKTDAPQKKIPAFQRAEAHLRKLALAYPETHEDHPWGESAFKVKGKVFLFMSSFGETFGTSTKLPVSSSIALMLPFAEPTGYGLGKSGWISARFAPDDDIPFEILEAWLDESYRAIAPKKLVATLPPVGTADAASPATANEKKPATRKTPHAKKAPHTTKKKPAAAAKKPPATQKKPAAAAKSPPPPRRSPLPPRKSPPPPRSPPAARPADARERVPLGSTAPRTL